MVKKYIVDLILTIYSGDSKKWGFKKVEKLCAIGDSNSHMWTDFYQRSEMKVSRTQN